ncbi:MAG: Flp family type IVb pilin [Devosia sp.]
MIGLLQRFAADEDGATAIEYGLMAALIGVAAIAAFIIFGNSLKGLFGYVDTRTSNALNTTF